MRINIEGIHVVICVLIITTAILFYSLINRSPSYNVEILCSSQDEVVECVKKLEAME